MDGANNSHSHSAEDAALGYYYQAIFALSLLLDIQADEAAAGVETLDDVHIDGTVQSLNQLKHSMGTPDAITVKSDSFWKTIACWIDVFGEINLADTLFNFITVADISDGSSLNRLRDTDSPREEVVSEMVEEAQRVETARANATLVGKSKLPYDTRARGCHLFLNLPPDQRLRFVKQINLKPGAQNIVDLSESIAKRLDFIPPVNRGAVSERLIAWWDRQVVLSLTDKRSRYITKIELQQAISEFISDAHTDKLVSLFDSAIPPEDYKPHERLAAQINLVKGLPSEIKHATLAEWRARAERSNWIDRRLGVASKIKSYDDLLIEEWDYVHGIARTDCASLSDAKKCVAGLEILRWTHNTAPTKIKSITDTWQSSSYVRGCFQILAIDMLVGWHPDYKTLLGGH